MKSIFAFLIIATLTFVSFSTLGVDVATPVTTTQFTCMKNQQGIKFVIVRAYRSFGGIDSNAPQTLQNARTVGLETDIYMFPCRGKSASTQAEQMLSKTPSTLYSKVWLDVQTNPSPNCGWGKDFTGNCAYLTELVKYIKGKGKQVGIYASGVMWQSILGSKTACSSLAAQSPSIWYAHYDKTPSFSDFAPFGGWKTPTIKQYQGDIAVCGIDSDRNYRA